jgi:TPR repeat protein
LALGTAVATAAAVLFVFFTNSARLAAVPNPATGANALVVAAHADGTLRALLAASDRSPRGRSTADVGFAAALTLADRHLHGDDQPRDQPEASFWLRHALSLQLDTETTRWALTQLGTLHAAPEVGQPDYAKARLLWELAGALGDPVALCFNAALHEYGLGLPKQRDRAHGLYARAREAGGCAGLDAALARTR